jgi:RNA methyltransferase, TrmH family
LGTIVFMKELQSIQNPIIKHLVKLREKKDYRLQCNSAILSGIKIIKELSSNYRYKTVLIEKGFTPPFPINAEQIFIVNEPIMKKVTGLVQSEPLAAEIALPKEQDLSKKQYLLILDGISDPGNMGTLLRTAVAFGWQGVLITPGSTDPFNEKALRAAKGATFKIPLKTASFDELENFLASTSYTFLAADSQGTPMDEISIRTPIALALGNEATGLSAPIKRFAKTVAIPIEKQMESLNVACAGAILMQFLVKR